MLRTSLAALALAALAIVAGSAPVVAPAATHTVNQVGFDFIPADITIDLGDTVEWVWSGGAHTVTEGVSLADTIPPPLFDEPLTIANPLVSVTFTTAGDVDYYCEPHIQFDMIGVVRVSDATPVQEIEASSWSGVKNLYR